MRDLKWWMDPALWEDDSRDDRPLESQVFARIRLQASLARQDALRREVEARMMAARVVRKSLREMYAARGLTVRYVDGRRELVALDEAA